MGRKPTLKPKVKQKTGARVPATKHPKIMKKSYNDIKAQEKHIIVLCEERGRYCDNAKNRLDTQKIAQITRHTLTQHGFSLFGIFDKDEKHACVHYEPEHKPEPVKEQEPEPEPDKAVRQTPTERAKQMVTFVDWMNADEEHRKSIQDGARHAFINKMYAELLTDMKICELEHWDPLEFPRMLKDALAVCFPKQPKQLTIQFK